MYYQLNKEFICQLKCARNQFSVINCVGYWSCDSVQQMSYIKTNTTYLASILKHSVLFADCKVSLQMQVQAAGSSKGQCGGAVREIWWFSVSPLLGLWPNPSSCTRTFWRRTLKNTWWLIHGGRRWGVIALCCSERTDATHFTADSYLRPHDSSANACWLVTHNVSWLSWGECSSF